MSRTLIRGVLAVAVWAGLWTGGGGAAWGLTIYRIGGAELPPPELTQEEGVTFVQMNWADVDGNKHGEIDQLDFASGYITPVELDSTVNLTPLLEERGGQILTLDWTSWKKYIEEDISIFDGDSTTAYLGDGHFASHGPPHKDYIFDFGGRFLIERIKIFPRERFMADRFIESFIIGSSDGDPLKDGARDYLVGTRGSYYDFNIVYDITENTQSLIDLRMPEEPIHSLLFQAPENNRGIWEIAEFEIYGVGYAPEARYVSNIIDLGGVASLGALNWFGMTDAGAKVALTMRSGDDDGPNIYWRRTFRGDEISRFDEKGKGLTLATYEKLSRGQKAGITHDTENWDFWSPAYDFSSVGGDLKGDKPRRFLQFRADFESTREASGRLDYLEFAVSLPPVASEVVAEIEPTESGAGEVTPFSYRLLPRFQADDLGFDTIEIETPVRAEGVDGVRIGGMEVAFEELWREADGFAVRIPRVDLQSTDELIEVDFRSAIFEFGTVFGGRVADSERPHEVHQAVTPGDADPQLDGNRLSVALTEVGQKAIHAVRFGSSVLTPNGDGVNDGLEIEYDLLNLHGQVPVVIDLFDLSGRRVAEVYRGVAASGRFFVGWDGRNGSEELLPPGLYLLRLEVETDEGIDTRNQIISLAY
ncbi:MAG: hypothetical protein HOC74_29225 [Gemmatimonadetes bacterium]|jgi:hypothetical protein|nr:hypothetical protein [Gemmatimonadota bacterium]